MERDDFDREFWEKAGRLKATQRRVSLADCFGLTLAVRPGGEFLTTDHHELDSIASMGSYPITFIGNRDRNITPGGKNDLLTRSLTQWRVPFATLGKS